MRRALGLLLTIALFAAPAHAEPTPAEKQKAAHSFQIGAAAYAKGDFANAAAAFEKAALYAPHPSTLLNAAESWELAENPARSAQLCDRVLDTPNLESVHRQAAQKQLARVEKKIGTIVVKAPAKARIEVDDREEKGERSAAQNVRVSPGAHKVKVTDAQGESRTESLTVGAGETRELDFLTPPAPKPEDTKPSPLVVQRKDEAEGSSGPPLASWICFAGGAVAAGVGIYFGAKTLSAKDDFDARPTTLTRDEFKSSVVATDVALGIAVVSFAVGFVLWATSSPSKSNERASLRRLEWTW